MTDKEHELMSEMKDKLAEQQEFIEHVSNTPSKLAIVLRVKSGKAVYLMDGKPVEGNLPPSNGNRIRAGTYVKVNAETGAIVEMEADGIPVGNMAIITRIISSEQAEVEMESGKKVVMISPQVTNLKSGHRVQMDPEGYIILRNFGAQSDDFKIKDTDEIGVTWADIGGLEDAKQQLKEAIELPIQNPRIFERYGQKPPKGIVLYGPPGCGKTMLAKATVSSVARLHGRSAISTGFIYVKGPEILSKWVGESEQMVRSLFTRAREHFAASGFPAVIFLDEADAILGRRGENHSSDMERTIVPQFLSEMDGLNSKGAPVVLIATNRPDTLDPAVVRDGRVDRKIKITRPAKKEVESIFDINLKKKPCAEQGLAKHAAEALFSDSLELFRVIAADGTQHSMTLAHAVNGAMVAGIVGRAVSLAMRRDMKNNTNKGIFKDDLTQAVQENLEQMSDIDLRDEVKDFIHNKKIDAVNVERVRQ